MNNNTGFMDEKVVEAFEFAYNAHKGTNRKNSTIPYIVHPLDVASTLLKNNAPDQVVIAGLLHDVVEDTDYTLEDIRERFGDEVAELVDGASEPEELRNDGSGKQKTWRERKAHTIESITGAGRNMKMLSCGDKISNIRDTIRDHDRLGENFWKTFNASRNSQAWYYISMVKAFETGEGNIKDLPAFNEFKKCVEELFGEVEKGD